MRSCVVLLIALIGLSIGQVVPSGFQPVVTSIRTLLDADPNRAPLFLRLAWHASGTYDPSAGVYKFGSYGGTIRFPIEYSTSANAGLGAAVNLLTPLAATYSSLPLSYGDLFTLAGCVGLNYLGGPNITWMSGRQDAPNSSYCPPDGKLPQGEVEPDNRPEQNVTGNAFKLIFQRMGFTADEMVALIGAHSVGRAHSTSSGYSGPWTTQPLSWSNRFFVELLAQNWTYGNETGSSKNQYNANGLMMLPSDMALRYDPSFMTRVQMYATNATQFDVDFKSAFEKLISLGINQTGVFPEATTAAPETTETANLAVSSGLILGFPIWQVGAVAGAVFLLLVIGVIVIIVCCVKCRNRSSNNSEYDVGTPIPVKSMSEIQGSMQQSNPY